MRRRVAASYFALQALLVLLWWLALWVVPDTRAWFLPPATPLSALLAFALPDAVLVIVGSLVAAVFIVRRSNWSLPITCAVAGAMDYAALHVFAWACLTRGAWTSVLCMTPAALLSTVFALLHLAERHPFYRRAAPASPARNLGKTLVQITFFWTALLGVLPLLLVRIDPLPRFALPGQTIVAALLFVVLGAIGIATGVTMARHGQGTPLPLDAPRTLVVVGPYAYVRNPMALTGIGQGLCVGLALGSWLVIAYVLFGALVWNYVVRPSEEDDLEQQFGASFVRYRDRVRCWWPRLDRCE